MGIDVATWRARIGLNYCRQSRYSCRSLPVQWRATRLGVGEVMNSTPLLLQGCMAVVSLTLILGYTFRGRPIGRFGCGKVCRPKSRGGSVPNAGIRGMAGTGIIGVCLLLGVCAVVLALLLMAGDVERNPGPTGKEGSDQVDKVLSTVDNTPLGEDDHFDILTEMMPVASSWKTVGRGLRIDSGRLNTIQENNFGKPKECLSETLTCWLNKNYNVERFGEPTWRAVVKIVAHPAGGDNCALALTIAEQHSVGSATASQTTKKTPFRSQEDLCVSEPTSDEVFTSKGATVSPQPNSTTQSEETQKPLETGSPTPTSKTSSFPYLKVSGLTPEQQEGLRIRLCVESEDIVRKFGHLRSRVYESLCERNVPVDKLVTHLLSLCAFDSVYKESQKPALQSFFQELRNAKRIEDVLYIIKDCISFFNYHVIEHIVNELGTEQDRVELQSYEREFDKYSKRRVYECPPVYGSKNNADHADLVVKVDSVFEAFTVKELKTFQYRLGRIFCVAPQSVLHLCQVEEGCLQLIFQVPSFVQEVIFPLSSEQESALAAEGVIRLTCGDYQFAAEGDDDGSEPEDTEAVALPNEGIYTGLSSEALDSVWTENDLARLAQHMINWEKYCAYFGLADFEEEEIKRDNPTYAIQKYKVLLRWKKKGKETATYRQLIRLFLRLEETEMAYKVREILLYPENRCCLRVKRCADFTLHTEISAMESTPTEVTIVGAGLVGPVLAILLVGKGFTVKIYETRKDPRQKESESRSFNLVLSKRGLDTLKKAGLLHKLLNGNTVPVDSRLVYQRDNSTYVWWYGEKDDVLHSIERNRLNRIVLDEAESKGVKIYFNHKVEDCNVQTGKLKILKNNEERFEVESNFIFGCDGAHSVVRMRGFMRERNARFHYEQSYIPYGYKELHIPVAHDGGFALEETHLHLWPRENFMLMGLPNPDKSITLMLFMPFEKFDEIGTDDQKIITLFEKEFPGVVGKLGGRKEFIKRYSSTQVGQMISIKCDPHHIGQALILGDAAHAMVPFYGQGVNAGFEDCLILDECLEVEENDLLRAVKLYAKDRPKNGDAIVGLSLYNLEEMRSKRGFQLKREVMRLVSKLTGQWITPLYSMVAFTRIPYHEVVKQHIQQEEMWRKIILLIFALIIAAVLYMCLPASNLVAIVVFLVLVVLFDYFTPMYSWKY